VFVPVPIYSHILVCIIAQFWTGNRMNPDIACSNPAIAEEGTVEPKLEARRTKIRGGVLGLGSELSRGPLSLRV